MELSYGDEIHIPFYPFTGPLHTMRDHAHWLAGLVLQHRFAAPTEVPLLATEVQEV